MPNEENLKKGKATQYRSGEEAAKNGKKGGKASGKSRRRKKAMKKRLQEALDMQATSKYSQKLLQSMGMDPDGATNYDALIASLLYKAVVKHDVSAMKQIMIYTGEDPDEKRKAESAKLQREQFEYQKEKDAGIAEEIEDLDELEADIYGESNQPEKKSREKTDDSV